MNHIPKRNDDVLAYRFIKGRAVVVDLKHSTLNTLNTTASRIWKLLEGKLSAKIIAEKITEEFEVPLDIAINDVVETLQDMVSFGWLDDFPSGEKRKLAGDSAGNNKEKLFETLRQQATIDRIPLVVHFDLTYRCSLSCIHCYLTDSEQDSECTTNEIKDLLSQLAEAGSLYITFSGGEIFLRNDLVEILSLARNLHFAVRLLTSGVLIDADKAKTIAAFHPEMISFSIYSLDASTHDAITRRKGSLAATMNAIDILKAEGVPLKISSVLMDRNVNNFHDVYGFAKKMGAQFQADYRITPKIDGSKKPLEFHISEQQVAQLLCDPIFSKDYQPAPEEGYSGIFDTIPCGAGHMSCYISPYGVITPCVQVPIDCGSIRENIFLEIWNSSSALNKFRSIRFSDIPKCVDCELFDYCRPCLGLNMVETGNIATPPRRVCIEAEHMKTIKRKRR